jgi:hypothetical protein
MRDLFIISVKIDDDPIWDESARAISIALQMLTNDGITESLFRGAFMQSGAPLSVGDITLL